MEEIPRLNQIQGTTGKTTKFIPVPIRQSGPVLESCYIPTANSAYLRVTDSITSFNSSVSSSITENNIVESNLPSKSSAFGDSLADPLARLLIPGVPTTMHSTQLLTNTCTINSNSPSGSSSAKIVSKSPQETEKISSATLSKLLTTTNTPPSYSFLNYICSTTTVDTDKVQPADEPTYTVTSVKRSDRELVKAVRQKKEPATREQDPYVQSVAMLTQLVTQNTHLVKTALDAISVAAIKPQQANSVNHVESTANLPSFEKSVQQTPQIPQIPQSPQHQHQHQQQSQQQAITRQTQYQRCSDSYRSNTKTFQRKPTRIPKPVASPSANNEQKYALSSPIFTSSDTCSTVKTNSRDNLIGVPIRAQEYMPNGSNFDFLNALIKEENHEEIINIQKGSSTAPIFDPFLNDLVNAASQLDDIINNVCSDVSYPRKPHKNKEALLTE